MNLTRPEVEAILEALGQMTIGNSYDFEEWQSQTSGTRAEWKALLRGEAKLKELKNGFLKEK